MRKKPLPTSDMVDSQEQFEALYTSSEPLIYRFMFWRTKDAMLAEDLTSSVYEKAWKTRQGFTGGSATAWLYRIAHTTLIDYWRKKKDILDEDTVARAVSTESSPAEVMDQKLAATQLQQALAKLPKEMRSVVELRFMQGQSARMVAEQLGTSEANVRVIQYRALQKLRKYLQ